jgi:phosphoglycolate phosphatase
VGAKDAKRDKPAPDPIFMALDGTGIAPDHGVWMVGDTLADLKCAHAAGVLPVFFGSVEHMSDLLREFPPRLHARDCHELAALL